jgi:hypothetical protein
MSTRSTHVSGDEVDLGVAVLSSLGGGHVNDLARSALDDDVSVLSESGTLHPAHELLSYRLPNTAAPHAQVCIEPSQYSREGLGGTGSGGLEGLVVLFVGHFLRRQLVHCLEERPATYGDEFVG